MAAAAQTYRNHFRLLPPYHYFALPVLAINVFYQIYLLWSAPSAAAVWAVVVALALAVLALFARVMALKVQDRVIRLEMRLRLAQVLPADLQGRINELTPAQLVALRFACDSEMPALVRDVLEGRVTKTRDIKMKVKEWQGDFLRA